MSERVSTAATASAVSPEEMRGLRVALSPHVFRGMLLGTGAAAVALYQATRSRRRTWAFAKARARTLAWMLGVQVDVRGVEHVADGGPYVFASNHQSHLDILCLLGFLPGETRFAAKKELWDHPIMAAIMDTLEMVPIDREHPEVAVEALKRAARKRQSIVIFPEGTRSRNGSLRLFKKGAFAMAIATGMPIVPVVCRGTRRLMPRGSRLTVVPGQVEVVICPPIPTADLRYDDRDELAGRVRAAIETHHTGW
jgi:1-acyl-sn-glycerol-3-phosphate acyltransferase